MELVRAFDFSFDAAKITPEWMGKRKREGYELAIVCLWTGNATPLGAEEALRIAREAGLKTACYGAVHDGRPGAEHVRKMMGGAGQEWPLLEFVAIDCEEIAGVPLHPETISDALYAVDATGQLGIIYTRGSYWREVQGDIHQFAPYELWEAFFDGAADLYGAASLKLPFGGFGQPVGKQYQGTTDLDGVAVDLSVFSRGWLESLTERRAVMPDLTDDVRNSLDALRGWAALLTKHPRTKRVPQAAKELADASRVLDRAFGIGQ